MKDIGIKFKEAREEIGVTVEEAAADMQITIAQLENLEDGNANAFKDIFFLKELIKKYAKYLNVKEDEIIEDFNDFIFNFTSRIPVAEIEEKVKEINKEEKLVSSKRIVSPYTVNIARNKINSTVLYILAAIVVFAIILVVFVIISN